MKRATWLRVALCGLVAGVVWYLLTVVSMTLSAPDLIASVQSRAPHPSRGGGFFFALEVRPPNNRVNATVRYAVR